jgi:hypothetical protein
VRPPGSDTTRCYSVTTLERWLYAFKRGGLDALVPQARTDKGRGRDLAPELRELLCDIRREHPEVSVTLIDYEAAGPSSETAAISRCRTDRPLVRALPSVAFGRWSWSWAWSGPVEPAWLVFLLAFPAGTDHECAIEFPVRRLFALTKLGLGAHGQLGAQLGVR